MMAHKNILTASARFPLRVRLASITTPVLVQKNDEGYNDLLSLDQPVKSFAGIDSLKMTIQSLLGEKKKRELRPFADIQ